SGAQIPGNARPAPRIDEQAQCTEGLDIRATGDAVLPSIARVLTAHQIFGRERPHGSEDRRRLLVHRSKTAIRWRLHREQRDDLKQVILNDIAQASCGLVKGASPLYAEVLRERDLHAGNEIAIPDRLEKGVRKAKVEDVHDRFLGEEVIDT